VHSSVMTMRTPLLFAMIDTTRAMGRVRGQG
jgi:hypothetical protein